MKVLRVFCIIFLVIGLLLTGVFFAIKPVMQKEIDSQFSSLQMMNIMMTMIPYAAYAILLMGSISYIQIYFTTPILTILFVLLLAMPLVGACINQKMVSNIKKGA